MTDTIVYKFILDNSIVIVPESFILEIRLIDGAVSPKVIHIRFKVFV